MLKRISFVLACLSVSCGSGSQTANDHTSHATPGSTTTSNTAVHENKGVDHSAHGNIKSSTDAAKAPIELQFLDSMIAHHQGAVDMATLAEARAAHSELKELAANIISDQEREIARMSEWRDRWFEGKSPAVNMNFPGMARGMGVMDMKKLEESRDNAFDIEFLKQMIPHHEGAIEMARFIRGHDGYKEIKELADDIISEQEAEIAQMREWLDQWQPR